MVLKADGSKYACQSCLKGHRVSACTHTDRELFFVPKKGRPVTQCQHCRQERKKRSSHVRCDCGETEKPHHSKEKCIHLREAEERAKAGFHDDHPLDKDPNHLSAVAEEQGCCCHHGGKCTCSQLKKETSQDGTAHGPAVKPRLEKTNSDTSITVFTNGHHKPVHRKNHAAHECGMPYKMPMPRSHTDQAASTFARRSVDSLALDGSIPYQQTTSYPSNTNGSFNNSRQSSTTEAMPAESTTLPNGGPSRTGSQIHGFNGLTQTTTNQSVQSVTSDTMSYAAFDSIPSATDGTFEPWSTYPSADSMNMADNNPFAGWTMNDNFTMVQPALTAGSSGTQSEIDEIPPSDDFFNFGMPSIQEDVVGGVAIPNLGGNSPQSNRRSLPASFFGNFDFTSLNGIGNNNNVWQTPPTDNLADPAATSKARPAAPPTSDAFVPFSDEAWQLSNMALSTSVPQRQMLGGNLSAAHNPTGRPQSHSVGPGSAPGDDLMRQLFPDFDVDNDAIFGSGVTGSPVDMTASTSAAANDISLAATTTTAGSMPNKGALAANTSSAPSEVGATNAMDLTLMDDVATAFATSSSATQNWSDGSISIPNDPYTPSPYDINPPDFATPDLNEDWVQ